MVEFGLQINSELLIASFCQYDIKQHLVEVYSILENVITI